MSFTTKSRNCSSASPAVPARRHVDRDRVNRNVGRPAGADAERLICVPTRLCRLRRSTARVRRRTAYTSGIVGSARARSPRPSAPANGRPDLTTRGAKLADNAPTRGTAPTAYWPVRT